MKESILVSQILQYLRYRKVLAWRNRNVGVYNRKTNRYIPAPMLGCSDIYGILKGGKFLAIEVKIAPNKPTLPQQQFLDSINQQGGIGFVAYRLEDVEEKIKKGEGNE